MKKEEFIRIVHQSVIEDNSQIIQEVFESTDRNAVTDEYWKKSLRLYDSLDDEGQMATLMIAKQSAIDAVATILGILDGAVWPENQENGYQLYSTANPKEKINEDLHDLFLELVEEHESKN